MNIKEQIRAEIERQMKYYDEKESKAWGSQQDDEDALWYQGHRKMCSKLLSFLDSLPEQPSHPSDLDEAAIPESEMAEWMKYGPHTNYPWCSVPDAIKITAEHFFARGKQIGAQYATPRWISVDERLPEMDEEVIVLTDELGTAPIYKISFGHIVDVERCIDYNGWNIPGVKYWMPCPEIPNND